VRRFQGQHFLERIALQKGWTKCEHRIQSCWIINSLHFLIGKGKVVLCFNWAPRHEGVLRSGCIAPRILDLGSRWRWVVSFTPQPLYPQGESPCYSMDRRLGGPRSQSGRGGEEKNSQTLPGLELPISQPIAQRYTTKLFRQTKKNVAVSGVNHIFI
jgi:hypothetical protein